MSVVVRILLLGVLLLSVYGIMLNQRRSGIRRNNRR